MIDILSNPLNSRRRTLTCIERTDDPNVTNQKFLGNPTKSYRSREPLRVTGEVMDWQGHSPEALKVMKENLERLKQRGVEAIDD